MLYRFAKPENPEFPFMLELFCRKPDGIELGDGQVIVPIPAGADQHTGETSDERHTEAVKAKVVESECVDEMLPFSGELEFELELGSEILLGNFEKERKEGFV